MESSEVQRRNYHPIKSHENRKHAIQNSFILSRPIKIAYGPDRQTDRQAETDFSKGEKRHVPALRASPPCGVRSVLPAMRSMLRSSLPSVFSKVAACRRFAPHLCFRYASFPPASLPNRAVSLIFVSTPLFSLPSASTSSVSLPLRFLSPWLPHHAFPLHSTPIPALCCLLLSFFNRPALPLLNLSSTPRAMCSPVAPSLHFFLAPPPSAPSRAPRSTPAESTPPLSLRPLVPQRPRPSFPLAAN